MVTNVGGGGVEPGGKAPGQALGRGPARARDQVQGINAETGLLVNLPHRSLARGRNDVVLGARRVVLGVDAAAGEDPGAAVKDKLRAAAQQQ